MTVVIYEGQDAKEQWKRDVARAMEFRHPSFLQLYGIAHSEHVHASIFYDDLIPWKNIESIFEQSPMLPCYIYPSAVCSVTSRSAIDKLYADFLQAKESLAALRYLWRCPGTSDLNPGQCIRFLRPSTGRLCIDFQAEIEVDWMDQGGFYSVRGTEKISPKCLLSSIDAQIIIDTLTVEQYHEICSTVFSKSTYTEFSLATTVYFGAVYNTTGHRNLGIPLAIAPALDIGNCSDPVWFLIVNRREEAQEMETGWSRFTDSNEDENTDFDIYNLWPELRGKDPNVWLSQANHVFNRLGVLSDAHNYGKLMICLNLFLIMFLAPLTSIQVEVELQPQSAKPTDWHSSKAFLFLCPPPSFQVGPASFKCPECVAYWSLDPSGVTRLSAEQACELGLPAIRVSITGRGKAWSDTIYAGLRQFHQGKGFDPDSQDLARHFGYPLYELYSDHENFLNVDGGEARIEELSSSDTDHPVDAEEPVNLGIAEDEKCESVSQTRNLDEEPMDVSRSLKLLSQIQLGLILLLSVLSLYGSFI
ncbi:hypothetical protein R3P38DRAFT_2623522 [Favolaschia claudopus]|uniref:Uncharacterized protein n=1 Tax=Favolaschia claudopus TaxID=2862362 RepID=A0AAW0BMD7_9AGAR